MCYYYTNEHLARAHWAQPSTDPNDPQVHRRGRYEEQMEVQAVSAALAEEFNRKVAAARADAKEVSFIPVTVLAIQGTYVRVCVAGYQRLARLKMDAWRTA